jgi:hypothetical protein
MPLEKNLRGDARCIFELTKKEKPRSLKSWNSA